ncbi:hypothetical protein [Hamadaea tsunoensis]|uniref:hypothetical protein n=1 Tax=Hamadaea tsunoensis TaxID=53368 RepID=UPI0004113619|nr:hypothetical protein [Hamadaea tsunoensis]
MVRFAIEHVLAEPQLSQAWRLYADAFAQLRTAAMQRHVMSRPEFDAVMADRRVEKHLAIDNGASGNSAGGNSATDNGAGETITGLATFTNVLEAMPLVSPEFFAHRWPDQYARHQVWYLGFFAIHEEYRSTGIFETVIAQMWAHVQAGGGVAALDVCGVNAQLGLPQAITRTLRELSPEVLAGQVDTQTYWAFELRPRS